MDTIIKEAFEAFISQVVSLRTAQKAYLEDKTQENFIKSKQLEREMDIILTILLYKKY